MAERIQFHFNNRAKNLSDAINRNDASLFPPELSPNEKNHNEEDELSPWSNILTPKLGVSVPKQIQNVHSLTSTWTHLKREATNQKRRPFTKEQVSIEEKPSTKSYKFYKTVLNKVSENMNPDTSNNELMRYKGSSSMSKIGLVDLSSPSPIERKDSKLQLIIGNMEEVGALHDYSGYSGVKSKADLGNDVVSNSKTYQDFRKTFGGNLKEVETELNPTETMKNDFKMYSQTARSLKELRKKKGEEVFTIPAKGIVHKKVLGRETVSRSLNKRLESKYLYANVLTQMTKTDLLSNRQAAVQQDPITVLGIISEGVRIVGSQRHSRTPSKVVPKKEEKSASEQRDDKYGIKDKLQILRRIRNRTHYQIQTSPSREEHRDSSKEDGNRDSSRLRPKITSPASSKKLYPKQGVLRTEITPPRRRLETDGGDGEQHVSLPQVVNNTSNTSLLKDPLNKGISKTRNKNSGSFNDELRKLLAYREKTQPKVMEANNETLLKTFETSKEIPEKPVYSTSPKFRTAAGFLIRQGSPIRQAQGDFGLTQEKFTKSFSQIKQRDSSVVELKTDALGVGPISPFFQNNGTPSKLLLSNSNKLGYRVGKRSNFEIQAALLQEQRVQKNIKTLKTEFKRE